MKIKKLLFHFFLVLLSLFIAIVIFSVIKVMQKDESYSTLTTAIENNNKTKALDIFDNIVNQENVSKKDLSSILLQAIKKNHIELAKNIIESINSDNESQNDWKPHERARYKNNIKDALLISIENNYKDLVSKLLLKEADPNYKEYADRSPLLTSAIAGNLEIVKELIQKGAQITNTDSYSKTTPLIEAATYGHTEIVHKLLSFPEITAREKNIAFLHAATNGHLKILEELLKHYANTDYTDAQEETALMKAAAHGHLDIVKKLLEIERIAFHINRKDFLNKTALFKAIENGHRSIVKELLKIPNIKIDPSDCYYIAAQKGYLDILKELLKAKSNEEIIIHCINYAINYNHPETIKELIRNYKNQIINKERLKDVINACLLYSAQYGHTELVKLLIEEHADPNTLGNNRNTPLILAAKYNHTNTVKLLLDAKANPNMQSEHIIEDESWLDEYPRSKSPRYRDVQMDWTALHYADNNNNNKEIIDLLLKAGANPNVKDIHNRKALSKSK